MEKRYSDAENEKSDVIALHNADSQQVRANRMTRMRCEGESSIIEPGRHKLCCQCGMELSHRPRFRDPTGRYWCPACNEKDQQKLVPTPCDQCRMEVPRGELTDYRGVLLCPVCMAKHRFEERQAVELKAKLGPAAEEPVDTNKVSPWPLIFSLTTALLCAGLIIYVLSRLGPKPESPGSNPSGTSVDVRRPTTR